MSLYRRKFMYNGRYYYTTEFQLTYDPNTYGEERYHTRAYWNSSSGASGSYTSDPGIGIIIGPAVPKKVYNIYGGAEAKTCVQGTRGYLNRTKYLEVEFEIEEVSSGERIRRRVNLSTSPNELIPKTNVQIYFGIKLLHDSTLTQTLKDTDLQITNVDNITVSVNTSTYIVTPFTNYTVRYLTDATSTSLTNFILLGRLNLLNQTYKGIYNIKFTIISADKYPEHHFDFYTLGSLSYNENSKGGTVGYKEAKCNCITGIKYANKVFGTSYLMEDSV